MGDLERLSGRAVAQQAGARDLVAIAEGINRLPLLAKHLNLSTFIQSKYFQSITNLDIKLIEIASKINNEIIDNPPLSLTEGGLIYDGINPILDGLRNQLDDHNSWLRSQEIKERGISTVSYTHLRAHET